MEKFTAGPWSVVEVPHAGLIGVKRGDRVLNLDGDQEADARLIAAAPDLLEALEIYAAAYNEHWKLGMPILEPISDAAIAKAKGEE